jgi:predicted DsbA family dithiol-disulfide isomerase
MNSTKPTIKIDIVSDVVCPWCYIGKRRLEKAIANLSNEFDFELEYHPFELNAEMPAEGADHKEYLSNKFGGESRYDQLTGHVTEVAQQEGLIFDYLKQKKSPNTRLVHSIVQLAKLEGKHLEAIEAFFKAYFTDGVDLTKKENLTAIAESIGLKDAANEKLFGDDKAVMQVALAEKEMGKLGITGVPFYIINNRYGVSGAQASETFVKAFREIGLEAAQLTGESCDTDGKNC